MKKYKLMALVFAFVLAFFCTLIVAESRDSNKTDPLKEEKHIPHEILLPLHVA